MTVVIYIFVRLTYDYINLHLRNFVLVVSSFQIFVTSSDNVVEPEAGSASATPDLNQYATPDQNQYANAYQVYQHWAQQQQQHPIHHKPSITKILKNRQDSFAGDIEAFFGPDAGVCHFYRLLQISDQINYQTKWFWNSYCSIIISTIRFKDYPWNTWCCFGIPRSSRGWY